jgi:hypothetical protein
MGLANAKSERIAAMDFCGKTVITRGTDSQQNDMFSYILGEQLAKGGWSRRVERPLK